MSSQRKIPSSPKEKSRLLKEIKESLAKLAPDISIVEDTLQESVVSHISSLVPRSENIEQLVLNQGGQTDSSFPADKPTILSTPKPTQRILETKPQEDLKKEAESYDLADVGLPVAPRNDAKYHPLTFLGDPIDMLFWLDENYKSGTIGLYDWQMETNIFLASAENYLSYTKEYPLRFHLCAVNGSGKDAFVIAPFVVWKILTSPRARCIITSSSFQQLSTQTEAYIRNLANQINVKMATDGICEKVFTIKKQHIICELTKSEIVLFATDEERRAEGYHPFPDYPGAEMWMIINEAKSVKPNIFRSLYRCTGYNGWVEISSPGADEGDFFTHFSNSVSHPEPYNQERRYCRRITAYDCKHISKSEIEEASRELPPDLFGSIYLGKFSSVGSQKIISKEKLLELFATKVEWDQNEELCGGLDLSLGGDETTFVPRQGNRQKAIEHCRIRDPEALVEHLENWFLKWDFEKKGPKTSGTPINTDVGGLGLVIARMLENRFWNIINVNNNSPSSNRRLYRNRAAEGWSHLGNMVNRKLVILLEDDIQTKQLAAREYFYSSGVLDLEDKKDCKARIGFSPDRGDAVELAFKDFVPKKVRQEQKERYNPDWKRAGFKRVTQSVLLKSLEEERYSGMQNNFMSKGGLQRVGNGKRGQRSWVEEELKAYNKIVKEN